VFAVRRFYAIGVLCHPLFVPSFQALKFAASSFGVIATLFLGFMASNGLL
jgi:hypothetical protein